MALHTTAITPATSVLKIRIFGDSGSGRVSTLPRGTIIGTQPGFPQNYDDRYHEPMLIGIPDGWVLSDSDGRMFSDLSDNPGGGTTFFVPVVLAEEVTVRKQNGHVWADTFVSVVIRGVSELIAKFDKRDLMFSKPANKNYWAGSQIFCTVAFNPATNKIEYPLVHDRYSSRALTAFIGQRTEFDGLAPGDRVAKPLGQLVFPPNFLATAERSLYSSVFIDTLTSKALRQQPRGADNNETYDHGPKFDNTY